jgi:hypothetical protein
MTARGRLLSGLVATVIALAGFVTVGAPTAAAGSTGTLEYVALGDSYAAGIGAPPYRSVSLGDKDCVQSINKGYPAFFDPKGRIDLQVNATCPGATTTDVANIVNSEKSPLNPETRLVTLTVGGNNLNFRDVLTRCTLAPTDCKDAIAKEVTLESVQTLSDNLTNLYAEIAAAAPEARIVVTGYPILFDAERPSDFSPDMVINPVNEATASLNGTIEHAVAVANDADVNIHYVDVT